MHPIPLGFKRETVQVKQREDGCTLDYTVVDRELPLNWSQAHVTRLEATHTIRLQKAEMESRVAQDVFGDTIPRMITDLSRGAANPIPLEGMAEAMIPIALRAAATEAKLLWDAQPVSHHHVRVRVWGDKTISRDELELFAKGIVNQRLSSVLGAANPIQAGGPQQIQALGRTIKFPLPTFLVPYGLDCQITHDITGKRVEVDYQVMTGPLVTAGLGLAGNSFSMATVLGGEFGNDDTGDLIGEDVPNVSGPPEDGVSRGTYLEVAVAQALYGLNGSPQLPPAIPDLTSSQQPSTTV
jgi:hypothetical protein